MFSENFPSENREKLLKIGVILILVLGISFILIKIFILKPKQSTSSLLPPPEEVKVTWSEQERTEIKKNIFVKLIKIEDYTPAEGSKPQKGSNEGFKFSSLEIEVENNSNEPFNLFLLNSWLILSQEGNGYSSIYPWKYTPPAPDNPLVRQPTLLSKEELMPGEIRNGFVSFQIPENISIKEVRLQIYPKTITFEIPHL